MHHPTVILDGERWNVVAENAYTLTVVRGGERRVVRVEDVR